MFTRLVLPGIVVLALIATMVAVIYACLRLFAGFANDDHRNYEDYVARFDEAAFDVTLVMRREDYGRDPDAPGPAETELHWLKSGPDHRLSYETDRATTGTYFIDQQTPTTISCTGEPPSNCRPNTELGEPEIWDALLAGVMVGVFGSSSPSLIAEGPQETRARDDRIGGRAARCFSLN
ncbi:MAG TPA: hypothetical protein VNM91_01680, partial [Dehalococcoidia bacterium]|nr:hypothetical protein [Dehalococcoidia bacterium]